MTHHRSNQSLEYQPRHARAPLAATDAEVLFVSPLQPSDHPTPTQVHAAIDAMRCQCGVDECACRVAAEYGDHPDLAAERMAWCRAEVESAGQQAAAA